MLKIIGLGTGRDGTVTLNKMVSQCVEGSSAHEYRARELHDLVCDLHETGSSDSEQQIHDIVKAIPHAAVVGNGYESILPIVFKYHPDVKIIHLQRSRQEMIDSYCVIAEKFPEAFGNYGAAADRAVMNRITAFHKGEMTKQDWEGLPIPARFGWYYDYVHAQIEQNKGNRPYLKVNTKNLSDQQTREAIAEFVGGAIPDPARLNGRVYVEIEDFDDDKVTSMQSLFMNLDKQKLQSDPVYATEFFSEYFETMANRILDGHYNEGHPPFLNNAKDLEPYLRRYTAMIRERATRADALISRLDAGPAENGT